MLFDPSLGNGLVSFAICPVKSHKHVPSEVETFLKLLRKCSLTSTRLIMGVAVLSTAMVETTYGLRVSEDVVMYPLATDGALALGLLAGQWLK